MEVIRPQRQQRPRIDTKGLRIPNHDEPTPEIVEVTFSVTRRPGREASVGIIDGGVTGHERLYISDFWRIASEGSGWNACVGGMGRDRLKIPDSSMSDVLDMIGCPRHVWSPEESPQKSMFGRVQRWGCELCPAYRIAYRPPEFIGDE